MKKIYLDNIACTPIDVRVKDSMMPYFEEHFGNPSSLHSFGSKPREAVEMARANIAKLIFAV